MKIAIRKSAHGAGNYCAYQGETLFATLHWEKPTRTNGRVAQWNVAYLTGRVEWFDTYSEARDCALKGTP